jgi:hypothetical protein
MNFFQAENSVYGEQRFPGRRFDKRLQAGAGFDAVYLAFGGDAALAGCGFSTAAFCFGRKPP